MATINNSGTIRFEPYSAAPEGSCAICLADFESQELNKTETPTLAHATERTHHVFHQSCLKDFFCKRLSEDQPTPCPLCMQPADPSSVLPLSEFMIYRGRQMIKNAAPAAAPVMACLSIIILGDLLGKILFQNWEGNYQRNIVLTIGGTIQIYCWARIVYLEGGPRAFLAGLQRRIAGI